VETLKLVLTAVEFDAVEDPKRTSAPGAPIGNVHVRVVPGKVPSMQFGGPELNVGNANDDVFVIVGVTFAIVLKLSGES